MKLEHRRSFTLKVDAPFNFDATFHNPSYFPTTDTKWRPGVLWQSMLWHGRPLGLKFESRGTVDAPAIRFSIWSQGALADDFYRGLLPEIRYRANLDLDLAEFTARFKRDPILAPVLRKWRGMRPCSLASLYEYLIIAIVLQNCTVRRSVTMMQALFERYGRQLEYNGKRLSCFWRPEKLKQVEEEELRGLKVGYRAKSILRVTRAFVDRQIDEAMLRAQPYAEQRAALLNLYGVGPASVGYILSDVLHHYDRLAHISPWEQKIYGKLFLDCEPENPPPVDDLIAFLEKRYGEWKMLAVSYVWADLWWRRKTEQVDWLEKLIRL